MDGNPYTPGAGNLPPVLAGRDELMRDLSLTLSRVSAEGRPHAQDMIIVGPRGVGKTVAITAYGQLAHQVGFEVVNLQAVAGSAGLVESLLQNVTVRVDENIGPWVRARKAFDRIAGISFGMAGVSAGLTVHEPSRGSRSLDPGTLAAALVALATEVKRDAPTGGVLVTVDEMQVASAADLALLAATLHRLNVDHPQAAVVFAGTGLPHTPEALRSAGVTHPDRLFVLEPLSVALPRDDARYAVIEPARRRGVNWQPAAAERVVEISNSYPAHLQQLAHTVWQAAAGPDAIVDSDVTAALPRFEADLHRRTLGPRWDRMSDREMEYLAALAVLGGRTTSARLAATLGKNLTEVSWIRQQLIQEGDIYSAQRGRIALAVPIFAPYILARYDEALESSERLMLTLDELRRNAAMSAPTPPAINPDRHAALRDQGTGRGFVDRSSDRSAEPDPADRDDPGRV